MRRSRSLAHRVLVRTATIGRRGRPRDIVIPDNLEGIGQPGDLLASRTTPQSRTGPISIPLLPGERTLDRRLKFALVNACTLASLTLGMIAVFLSMQGHVWIAAVCVLFCVTLDGLDGGLARKLGVASPFGAQMDSMADMASFGVATPVMVYAWLHPVAPAWLLAPACVLIAICAAIRLARFNVSPKDGRYFCGVPTTIAAAILGLCALLIQPAAWQVGAVAVVALLMVTTFPYAKLAQILHLPRWLLVIPILGVLADWRTAFLSLIALYLISGPLLGLRKAR